MRQSILRGIRGKAVVKKTGGGMFQRFKKTPAGDFWHLLYQEKQLQLLLSQLSICFSQDVKSPINCNITSLLFFSLFLQGYRHIYR